MRELNIDSILSYGIMIGDIAERWSYYYAERNESETKIELSY